LETEGLYSKEAEKFLFQDISEIYKRLPSYVSKVAKVVTDTGAVVSKLTGQGRGYSVAYLKDYCKRHNIKLEKGDKKADIIEKICLSRG
jgi:spermidine synthase